MHENVAAIVNTLVSEYEAVTNRLELAATSTLAMSYRKGLNSRERGILADAYLAADERLEAALIQPLVVFG